MPGQRRRRLASGLFGLHLLVHIQWRTALPLRHDRPSRFVFFLLPGNGVSGEVLSVMALGARLVNDRRKLLLRKNPLHFMSRVGGRRRT